MYVHAETNTVFEESRVWMHVGVGGWVARCTLEYGPAGQMVRRVAVCARGKEWHGMVYRSRRSLVTT